MGYNGEIRVCSLRRTEGCTFVHERFDSARGLHELQQFRKPRTSLSVVELQSVVIILCKCHDFLLEKSEKSGGILKTQSGQDHVGLRNHIS